MREAQSAEDLEEMQSKLSTKLSSVESNESALQATLEKVKADYKARCNRMEEEHLKAAKTLEALYERKISKLRAEKNNLRQERYVALRSNVDCEGR